MSVNHERLAHLTGMADAYRQVFNAFRHHDQADVFNDIHNQAKQVEALITAEVTK
jgi:hypothetical protein